MIERIIDTFNQNRFSDNWYIQSIIVLVINSNKGHVRNWQIRALTNECKWTKTKVDLDEWKTEWVIDNERLNELMTEWKINE